MYYQKSYGTALLPNLGLQCSVVEILCILKFWLNGYVCQTNQTLHLRTVFLANVNHIPKKEKQKK